MTKKQTKDTEKKDSYKEEFTFGELLQNMKNARKQNLTESMVDTRFLEIIEQEDPERKVPDDRGKVVPIQYRIDELKIGMGNIKRRLAAIDELIELDKKGKINTKFSDEMVEAAEKRRENEEKKEESQ